MNMLMIIALVTKLVVFVLYLPKIVSKILILLIKKKSYLFLIFVKKKNPSKIRNSTSSITDKIDIIEESKS